MESRYDCSGRTMETSFAKSATIFVLSLLVRLLFAFCAEEDQPLFHGLCEALPHFLPAEQLGLHLTWEHVPLSASPGGTLLRSVCRKSTWLNRLPFWSTFDKKINKNETTLTWTMGALFQALQTDCVVLLRSLASSRASMKAENPGLCQQPGGGRPSTGRTLAGVADSAGYFPSAIMFY